MIQNIIQPTDMIIMRMGTDHEVNGPYAFPDQIGGDDAFACIEGFIGRASIHKDGLPLWALDQCSVTLARIELKIGELAVRILENIDPDPGIQ
jgi:hypothetical protein